MINIFWLKSIFLLPKNLWILDTDMAELYMLQKIVGKTKQLLFIRIKIHREGEMGRNIQ